ncbi:MAG: ornithine carbamoyltransferase [Planctomycetota bacterium]|jgi:ornithine carbamoyltransferase|nr:ornithine carbamoyltransferase [Planctomycetota bacterium]
MRNILSLLDLGREGLEQVIAESAAMKARLKSGIHDPLYRGKTLGMYFEKPSLRTRVSLETAMNSLGGGAVCLEADAPNQFWSRESVKDQARVMSRFVSLVAMRTFSQAVIEEFARESSVPIINVLSDYAHPTQVIADFLTFGERCGPLGGKRLVYFGDGNNVARSLLSACALTGVRFVWSGPASHRLEPDFVRMAAERTGGNLSFIEEADPIKAVAGADAVYTDVWASMGQESEAAEREKLFLPYQVNERLMAAAPPGAIVLHCLPAHRGLEITDGVMDGEQSAVYDQAENRMHVYRGIFSLLAK